MTEKPKKQYCVYLTAENVNWLKAEIARRAVETGDKPVPLSALLDMYITEIRERVEGGGK
jgi:hypothetical protein